MESSEIKRIMKVEGWNAKFFRFGNHMYLRVAKPPSKDKLKLRWIQWYKYDEELEGFVLLPPGDPEILEVYQAWRRQ